MFLNMISRRYVKYYKNCHECDRVFKCKSSTQKRKFIEHISKCELTKTKTLPIVQDITLNDKELPVIENGFKMYEELARYVQEIMEVNYICIIDNYASEEVAIGVIDELKYLYSSSELLFYKAENDAYRSDMVYWLHGKERRTSHIKLLKRSINTLIKAIKFDNIPQITHFTHFQISCFPMNSFGYVVHVDNPNNNGCLLTVVYYCNEKYDRDIDGGVQRFFIYDKKVSFDIEPKFNRAVIYWSDLRVAHGTCKCHQELFSLTSWYFNST